NVSLETVAGDIRVAVAMGTETLAAGDAVLVDHPQRAPVHVPGIEVVGEGEAVPGIQPAMVGVATLGGRSQGDHRAPPGFMCGSLEPPVRPRRQASRLKSPGP